MLLSIQSEHMTFVCVLIGLQILIFICVSTENNCIELKWFTSQIELLMILEKIMSCYVIVTLSLD